ncbi:hypothetical protein GK047_19630 [Paenibacillus sp. SYP-B3998]|uniref:RDRP core domain-containing protein n=1 Tax=Paenibacillus sp. SYP-B3998 TaxID=2678564 RepID=A0A6G4A1G3_9BACL|nr:hypothetical protein [Paenibacillus sp. SYP-B3998]NEW08215.1 hypothetical protein [Paenibacillus sp. SYP-B3998]
MSKYKKSLRYVYKIHSSLLKNNKWSLTLSPYEARRSGDVVSLASSQAIDFVDELSGSGFSETRVRELKSEIKRLKREKTSKPHLKKIKWLFEQLDELLFIKDYICVIMDNKDKDFDRANEGFYFNEMRFTRLYGTTGGVKNQTIVYVSEKISRQLKVKIENNRNLHIETVPARLEAYKSLVSSASTPVPCPDGVILVNDYVHEIEADIIRISDDKHSQQPVLSEVRSKVKLNINDGYGLISPELSKRWAEHLGLDYIPSGFIVRNSFCKGSLFTYDFKLWAEEVAGTNEISDAWETKKDISKAQMILTTSMLKLWDSYENMEHYLRSCKEHGYTFRVTKVTPEVLENERNLNYQFIQSLDLSDTAIDELIEPTVNEIKEVLGEDWRKSLLFLKGTHLTDKNIESLTYDFAQALMIDEEMINDPFVKSKIHQMIDERINHAKIGDLKIRGNYSFVAGDPYALCQAMFSLKVTGLLQEGEFYSKYWLDRDVDKVAAFRAPMTSHNNNRILRLKETEEMQKWFRYMNTVTILNAWDTTTHALNGCDMD